MKVRIIDIAKKAEVSTGTVDRILHNRGKVSKKAEEKVKKALKELGYAPDILARNLAMKKELHIVCLLPNPEETKYWSRPVAGIQKAINELSVFKVRISKVFFSSQATSFEEACQKALALNPNGVVYVPMFREPSVTFANSLQKDNIPFIHLNIFQQELKPLSFVGQEAYSAGKVAASLCDLALNTNDKILIAYISGEMQEYSHLQSRIEGFTDYFGDKGINESRIEHFYVKVSADKKNYEKSFLDFLSSAGNIKIIYVPNSRAYRIASILKKHNIKNILVIGFDTLEENLELVKEGYIRFLIAQQSKNQGYNAVILLFNALFKREKINNNYFLPIDILNKENIEFYDGIINSL